MTATLATLMAGTASLRTKVNQVGTFGITDIAPLPDVNEQGKVDLAIEATFNPFSDLSRTYYKTVVIFDELTYQKERDATHPLRLELFPGIFLYCQRPSISKNTVRVRCLCADWIFFYFWATKERGATAGKDFKPYVKKTDSPYRNPSTPGLCKHLIRLSEYLSSNGFLLV